MSMTLFLDRDGVLIKDAHFLNQISQVEFIPGVLTALRDLHSAGCRCVVATNQSGIARGYFTEEILLEIHQYIDEQIQTAGGCISSWYYCPHHPDYTKDSACRKPNTGMVDQAIAEHDIDLAQSWFIGDKTSDILCGKNAGMRTILVQTGYGGSDAKYTVEPDMTFPDFPTAARHLLNSINPKMC